TLAITVSNWRASTCSPRAPIASEVIVTPSCIAAMNRGGSLVIRSTARARRLPSRSSSRMRVRRDVTRPYSAATKKAFRRIRPARARSSRKRVIRPSLGGRIVPHPPAVERMFYHGRYAGRVPRGALQGRAQPRQGDGVHLVAQPVHGVRPPLHLLLR